tara:strand:+ start:8881 stop:10386 length:1506 start_codon:yes stop_codon:yes gene_type:complete
MPFRHPSECLLISWDEIEQDERGRTELGDLDELKESITRFGLLQPPVVTVGETLPYKLVDGGRRMLAMRLTGTQCFPVVSREKVAEADRLEMELIANMDRLSMTWQEECILIYRSHRLHVLNKADIKSSWGTRETGKIMGCSPLHVSHALHVAELLLKLDEDICNANSITDAYNILFKRKESECDALQAKQIRAQLGKVDDGSAQIPAALLQPKSVNLGDMQVKGDSLDSLLGDDDTMPDLKRLLGNDSPEEVSTFFEGVTDFPLSQWIRQGDSVNDILPTIPADTFDHIITDPPYGIDIEHDYLSTTDTVIETHNKDDNMAMFIPMMKEFYRTLRSGGYCIIWYDIEHDRLLRDLAIDNGFKCQTHPLIWVKTHPCKNQVAQMNFTKQHETALVLRKGNAAMELPGASSVIIADGNIERAMYSNPFAKPYKVWKHLITAVSKPGQIIADPFGGQQSCARATLNLGRIPWSCEIDPKHHNRGNVILTEFLQEMTNGKANIT